LEVSHVRNRLRLALQTARERAQARRQRIAEAEQAFERFLAMTTPIARQLANALKVEGYAFTVFTPERALRLAADRGRDEFIDLSLDTSGDEPQVMARISYSRGSRTLEAERPVKPGAAPDAISEEEVLDFLLDALQPWMGR
jgi:hypothetical protein